MRQNILDKARQMFLNLGFKSVTMDDIANELGVSKKTLYKYFCNKQFLVEETIAQIQKSCVSTINIVTSKNFSSIKENFEIKKMFRETFRNVSGSPLFQLKKYYPKTYEKVVSNQMITVTEFVKNNVKKGIKEGVYRKDIDVDVCVNFYLSLMFAVYEKERSNVELLKLEQQALEYHTRAIATQKGIEELENQLKSEL